MPSIRSPASSSTMSAHGSCAALGAGRYCANAGVPHAAVGTSREPRQPRRGRAATRAIDVVPLQPQRVRRHRQRRVLVQQRGERVDVVALERVARSARRSAACVVATAARGASAEVARAERRARALQRAVHRGDASCRGSPPPRPPTSRAPRVSSSTARCRGGRCCSAATNASRMLWRSTARSRGIGVGGQRERVGDRLDPVRRAARRRARRRRCRPGRSSIGRARRALGRARRGRRWSRCGRATCAATSGPRTGRGSSTRAPSSPAPRRRRRRPSRACGSSGRSARRGAPRGSRRWPCACAANVADARACREAAALREQSSRRRFVPRDPAGVIALIAGRAPARVERFRHLRELFGAELGPPDRALGERRHACTRGLVHALRDLRGHRRGVALCPRCPR